MFPQTTTAPEGPFEAGEVITITVNIGPGLNLSSGTFTFPNGATVAQTPATTASRTLAAAVVGSASVQVTGIVPVPYSVTFACTGAPNNTTGSTPTLPTASQQLAQNAQTAITNGQLALQQGGDAIRYGVLGSFSKPSSGDGVARLKALPARASETQQRMEIAAEPQREAREGAVRMGRDDLASAFCIADADSNSCETDPRWNAWIDGRYYGINDSSMQQTSTGFLGQAGGDYKLLPWFALGVSVGIESFQTQTGPSSLQTGTNGVSVMPYIGVRLDENLFLSAFFGTTHINYNATPQAGITGQFDSWRLFGGGALAGLWYVDAWRFQPTLSVNYGAETQNAYMNSAGTAVPGQTVNYGRAAAGPEVGYAFTAPDRSWTVEPFATARVNLDFGNTNAVLFNGVQVSTRGPASGSVGGGVRILLPGNTLIRAAANYDSLGIAGLDIWSAHLRASWGV